MNEKGSLNAFAAKTVTLHNTSEILSNKREMAPGMGFDVGSGQWKKGRVQTPNHGGSPKCFNSNATSSKPVTEWWPTANASPLSSAATPSVPTANTGHSHTWRAPDSKVLENTQSYLQNALSEATKRAVVAERKATEYLRAKDDAELRLHNTHSAEDALKTVNDQLTAEVQTLNGKLQKLEKHAKNCERATNKAQKDALHAKGLANHIIKSQAGNLRSAEQRAQAAAQELKEWKEKSSSVEKPAEENAALQKRLSEWPSEASKAPNETAASRGDLRKQQRGADVGGNNDSIETEGISEPRENQSSSTTAVEDRSDVVGAEARAAKYKGERDALYGMLRGEAARNAKVAESLVLRNAKIAESLEGWDAR